MDSTWADTTIREPSFRFREIIKIPKTGVYYYLNPKGEHLHRGERKPCKCALDGGNIWKSTIREPQGDYTRVIDKYRNYYIVDKKGRHTHGHKNIIGMYIPCSDCNKEPSLREKIGLKAKHDQ